MKEVWIVRMVRARKYKGMSDAELHKIGVDPGNHDIQGVYDSQEKAQAEFTACYPDQDEYATAAVPVMDSWEVE